MKLNFSVRSSASVKPTEAVVNDDEEMKEDCESASKGQKKGKKDKVKGIPRKALKNLINNELEK